MILNLDRHHFFGFPLDILDCPDYYAWIKMNCFFRNWFVLNEMMSIGNLIEHIKQLVLQKNEFENRVFGILGMSKPTKANTVKIQPMFLKQTDLLSLEVFLLTTSWRIS